MSKTFKGFTNQQTHQLLKESGYTGPAQKDDMDKFLASSPKAAAQIGRYAEIARMRVEGEPLSGVGLARGGKTLAVDAKGNLITSAAGGTFIYKGKYVTEAEYTRLAAEDAEKTATPAAEKAKPVKDIQEVISTNSVAEEPDSQRIGDVATTMPVEKLPEDEPLGTPSVLQQGTVTPQETEFAEQLDIAQKTSADAGNALSKIQQDMSGKSLEDVYYRRDDYKGLADAQGSDAYDYQWNYDRNVNVVKYGEDFGKNPDFLARYDIDGDGVYTQTDFSAMHKGRIGQRSVGGFSAVAITDEQWQKVQKLVDEDFVAMYPGGEVTYGTALEEAQLASTQADGNVAQTQEAFKKTDIPSTAEALGKAITSPSSLLSKPTVYGLDVKNGQLIDSATGQVATAATLFVKQAESSDAVDDPAVKATLAYIGGLSEEEITEKYPLPTPVTEEAIEQQNARIAMDAKAATAGTYEAITSQEDVKTALEEFAGATGTPSDEALMKAETMDPADLAQLGLSAVTLDVIRQIPELKMKLGAGETPEAALFDSYTVSEAATSEGVGDVVAAEFATDTPKAEAVVDYNLTPTQVVEQETSVVQDAANFAEIATAEEKQSEYIPDIVAEETNVGADEVVEVNEILNAEEVIVTAKVLETLNDASTAKAATATFSQQLEAKAILGEVGANSTVQAQMSKLMESFNDGTPAWAAGALRKMNTAMAARGMGSSSMAGAAMIQAAMESAIPIAQADAATFANMDIENMRNKQTVALANAAAAQGFELANLSNEQATRIQNSMNNANLQLTNLSNEQEAVLATAGFKASLQGQELSISANVALANAARYASVNDINLNNRQQTSLLKSTQNLEVEMTNLSNSQQTALSNLQVQAAMRGQELTNEQQMAVLESTQAFEENMGDATRKQAAFMQDAVAKAALEGKVLDNKQQTALFNISNEVAERGIELNNEQQTNIFNMSSKLTIEVEELSGRQATALANAQIEAAMKGQELSNKQQVNVITAERIAEIANVNFTAEQSRVLQNANLAQTVDLANLSNEQAKLMADVASMADVDMANLNNRQQAGAQQAQAFLQMDMANLDNEQQAVMFEAQSFVQSIFSDQSAENANLQFNAESINQVNQFYDGLTTSVQQFNTAQDNAMAQFNSGEENSMVKFQAELDNQRDFFNASNELVIAQANTVWRQSVATINTATLNEANMKEVMAANNLSMQGLNELWQQERDLMSHAWQGANSALDRDMRIAVQTIDSTGAAAEEGSAGGNLVSTLLGKVATKVIANVFGVA